jgi:hypothetical protein
MVNRTRKTDFVPKRSGLACFHCFGTIPNFNNFLSLCIFAQSLAKQNHTTKQATIDIQKCQNEHTLHSTHGNLGTQVCGAISAKII